MANIGIGINRASLRDVVEWLRTGQLHPCELFRRVADHGDPAGAVETLQELREALRIVLNNAEAELARENAARLVTRIDATELLKEWNKPSAAVGAVSEFDASVAAMDRELAQRECPSAAPNPFRVRP